MSKHFIAFILVAASSVTLSGIAQQTVTKVKNIPLQQTSPASGQQMYSTYCSACHGANGKGAGPAAPAMKMPPVDLTALSKNNGGVYPAAHVSSVLRFGVENMAHGTVDMPVWGDLMQSLHTGSRDSTVEVNQRITNLTDYIKQIQQK